MEELNLLIACKFIHGKNSSFIYITDIYNCFLFCAKNSNHASHAPTRDIIQKALYISRNIMYVNPLH